MLFCMNIKQKVIELCDSMIAFWQQFKTEVEAIPDEDNAELVCKWYDYFQEHRDAAGKLSETKYRVKEIERQLVMKHELKYEE